MTTWFLLFLLFCESVQHGTHKEKDTSTKRAEVFPRDRLFRVGSRATFSCTVPAEMHFNKMYLTGYNDSNMSTSSFGNRTHTLTVLLNQPSVNSCTDVICQVNTSQGIRDSGACAYVGYPPLDTNLTCETRDLQSVECYWTVGGDTHLSLKSPTEYRLHGSLCEDGSKGRCKVKEKVDAVERSWNVTAQNKLGKVKLSDVADLTKRIHMIAPAGMTASTVNARNVTLQWAWTVPRYYRLNVTCQVNVSHGETNRMREFLGAGLDFAVLDDLMPHGSYEVTVRCGTTQHFWRWSEWSKSVTFLTKGDVPAAPDVWMQLKGDQIGIIWKTPLANGHILDYEVTWSKSTETERPNRARVDQNRVRLRLDRTNEYTVTVTARNLNGSSPPSTITVPRLTPALGGSSEGANASWIVGDHGVFNLSWSASPSAVCGYTVDWCRTLGQSEVDWMKVPLNVTNVWIFSNKLVAGVRYSLSVYACTRGAPVLVEQREGYIAEKGIEDNLFKSLRWEQQDSDVEVSWDPISMREQSAFIQGYVLHCVGSSNATISVSTDDPEATSLTARRLNLTTTYTFIMKARTAVGDCGTTVMTVSLNSLTDNEFQPVVISLATAFGLLSIITILCYRHWMCIKHKVYPPIPKPVLMGKWSTLPGENFLLCVDQWIHSEAIITHVPPNPKAYYNQTLKSCTPPPFPLPSEVIPSQSCPLGNAFPNPSYNPLAQAGGYLDGSGPEALGGPASDSDSIECQPQSNTESFSPQSSMSCILTYILLPSHTTPHSCEAQSGQ